MIGKTFGNWFVISGPEIIKKKKYYLCRCNCGNEINVRDDALIKANSKFCMKCRHHDKKINSGDKFGSWTVIQEVEAKEKRKHYIVKCDCGTIKILKGIRLRFGDSLKCRKCGSTKHSMAYSKTYYTWESMIQRCISPNNTNYKHYGARGIRVTESWLIFSNFLADMGERPEGLELDRIDNDGNYEKSNCRWITHQENLLNKKRK